MPIVLHLASFRRLSPHCLQANHLPRIQMSPTNQIAFRADDVLPVDQCIDAHDQASRCGGSASRARLDFFVDFKKLWSPVAVD